jgi:hypothetical protein
MYFCLHAHLLPLPNAHGTLVDAVGFAISFLVSFPFLISKFSYIFLFISMVEVKARAAIKLVDLSTFCL